MTDHPEQPLFDEDEPSPEELAEAAALTRALEREVLVEAHHAAVLPALEAAHVLHAAQHAELSDARLDAIYASLEASLPAQPSTTAGATSGSRPARSPSRLWAWASAAFALGSVVLWLAVAGGPEPAPVASLPAPSAELLAAQAAAMEPRARAEQGTRTASGEQLGRAMRPYRAELLARLEAEYRP
ncbi:MAG: hypothetical protein R3B40_02435 [Polyangiales bacterium]